MDDMDTRHPETELIAYLKNELPAASRDTVARHLESCASCRETSTAFRTLLEDLAHGRAAPAVHWPRYRAELRARLEARAARPPWMWWRYPLPVAVSAGLATALVVVALLAPSAWRDERRARPPENFNGFEDVVLGTRLDLLREYPVVEHLELLENLDVIRQLDGLTGSREG
jgi:anti-sigma factor RsiW